MTDGDGRMFDSDCAAGVAALAAAIRLHLTPEECERFDADLRRWNRRYTEVVQELANSEEWQEIEHWRAYVLDLTSRTQVA